MKENSMIKTAGDGQADLFLGENGPVVRVRENAELGIDRLDLENTGIEKVIETKLDLKNGQILGSVKKMAAASKYEVKTPVGVAGIRGTEYSINSSGAVNVVSGTVVVVYVVNGVVVPAVTVTGGNSTTPPVGNNVTPTISAISAQNISILGAEVTTLVIGITTSPNGQITATLQGNNGENVGNVNSNPNGSTGNPTGSNGQPVPQGGLPNTGSSGNVPGVTPGNPPGPGGPGPGPGPGNSTTTGPGTTPPPPPSDTTIVDISKSGTTTGQE
jgi:hypothetical protein